MNATFLHDNDEENELVPVRITLALGRSNHTWEEKVVSLNLIESQIDEYPLQELAFEWLMRNEPEYLNKVAPSFWTLIHVEFVREGK